MKITFLGTGSSVADPKRNFPSILLEIGDDKILFDCGPGTVKSLGEIGYNPSQIDHIFITHFHPDHVVDYITMIFDRGLTTRKTLNVFGPIGLEKHTEIICNKLFPSIEEILKPKMYLKTKEMLEGTIFKTKNWKVDCTPTDHYNGVAYRIDVNGKSLLYSGDTAPCNSLIKLGKNIDIAVLECTYSNKKMMKKSDKHLYPEATGKLAREMKAKKLILTHLKPTCNGKGKNIIKKVKKYFGGEVIISEDKMSIKI